MYVLDGEDIFCEDFESMLTNPDDMKAYLRKLKESCNDFHTKFERSILESISKSSGMFLFVCKRILCCLTFMHCYYLLFCRVCKTGGEEFWRIITVDK